MKSIFLAMALSIACCPARSAATELSRDVVPPGVPNQVALGEVSFESIDQLNPARRKLALAEHSFAVKGYELVDVLPVNLETYKSRLRNEAEIRDLIRVKLSDIRKTSLATYEYEGVIPDGPALAGPWTSVIRVFRRPDGVPIFLSEWDYVSDGGAVILVRDLMNARVHGFAAFMTLKKARQGDQLTELAWATDKKYYTLTVLDDATRIGADEIYGRRWLNELADGLTAESESQTSQAALRARREIASAQCMTQRAVRIHAGERLQIGCEAFDRFGNRLPAVEWTFRTYQPEVATVDDHGWVSGVEAGSAPLSIIAQGITWQFLSMTVEGSAAAASSSAEPVE